MYCLAKSRTSYVPIVKFREIRWVGMEIDIVDIAVLQCVYCLKMKRFKCYGTLGKSGKQSKELNTLIITL
jgi:hypothetical protein